MTEPKFTKGPWKHKRGRPSHAEWNNLFTAKRGRIFLFGCGTLSKPDAHLITAAPELYEALSDLVSSLETEHVAVCLSQEIAIARAALAKARGDSSKTIGGGK